MIKMYAKEPNIFGFRKRKENFKGFIHTHVLLDIEIKNNVYKCT